MLLKIKKINIFNILSIQYNSAIVEKTVNLLINYSNENAERDIYLVEW